MSSPPGLSCVTPPANVWQGVLMLSQELALLPERAETKTRFARASAGEAGSRQTTDRQRPVRVGAAFNEVLLRSHMGEKDPMVPNVPPDALPVFVLLPRLNIEAAPLL